MPNSQATIDEYQVRHTSWPSGQELSNPITRIKCYADSILVGDISFWPANMVLVPTIETVVGRRGSMLRLHFPIDRYLEIINTFRYEKPVTIFVDHELFCEVASGREPTGEQESGGS